MRSAAQSFVASAWSAARTESTFPDRTVPENATLPLSGLGVSGVLQQTAVPLFGGAGGSGVDGADAGAGASAGASEAIATFIAPNVSCVPSIRPSETPLILSVTRSPFASAT